MKAYLTDSNIKLNIPIISQNDLSLMDKYDSIIIDNNISPAIKSQIINKFMLTTSVRKFTNNKDEIFLISSIDSFKSTLKKLDGIQIAEDKIEYKDLDIEKSCRVAYELSKDSLLVLDSSNKFMCSRLFRKIATDINMDYPNVFRQDALIDDLNYYLDKSYKFILVEQLNENLVINTLLYRNYALVEHYLTNDISKNYYISYNQNFLNNLT